ncbi:hypothetical protein H311_03460 [Anncaliia algerae PRA109]|nr:hypothetical protein H311_03460 [Anncaliia algerae PRA109]
MITYFDINDILMKEQNIKIRLSTKVAFPKEIESNTTFDVPIFSLEHIITNENCEILSDIISLEMQHELRANASPTNFTKQMPNFYNLIKYFYSDLSFFKDVTIKRVNAMFNVIINQKQSSDTFFDHEKEIINTSLKSIREFNKLGKLK